MIGLVGITPIEKAFYNMSKTGTDLQEYFFTYYAQKLVLLNRFYPRLGEGIPGFPDHGPKHVTRIMKLYGKMLKNNVPGLLESREMISAVALNFYEIYLLLTATVWHDVGNLLGREKHNQKVVEISNRLEEHFIFEKDLKKYVLQIAKAHTGLDGIRKEIPVEDTAFRNEEINLRFLGAILRFGDELEEGGVRVDEAYYEVMKSRIPQDKRIYWETCCCINRIEPNPDGCNIEVRAKVDQKNLFKLFEKNGKTVSLIDELLFRMDKINQERKYYMQFVRKHLEYKQVVFDLTVEDSIPRNFTFRFNNDQGYEEFWHNFPDLNPGKRLPNYTLQKEET